MHVNYICVHLMIMFLFAIEKAYLTSTYTNVESNCAFSCITIFVEE